MMKLLIVKYAITAFIIVVVSEVAKRSGKIGALISSLPMVTILVMFWMFFEKQENCKIAEYAWYTFWFVLPTLPMFIVFPYMMNRGINFWISLLSNCALTAILFIALAFICKKFGIILLDF